MSRGGRLLEPLRAEVTAARSRFLLPEGGIYFDCAYRGPTPRRAAEAAALSPVALDLPWGPEHVEDLRSALVGVISAMVGVEAGELALIPSASYGMALARSVARLQPGDQVLIVESEHPAAALPWYAQCSAAGARVLLAGDSTGSDLTETLLSLMDESVRVVSIPQVHWIDGRVIELSRVSRRARELGALLIVDATQSVGGRPFTIPDFQPDLVTFSGYKWLFGPVGVAYLYVAPPLRDLMPFEHSWISHAGQAARMFDPDGLLEHPLQPLQGMHRFDASGLHNPLTLRMALAGAELARELGPERVLAHNAGLISRLGAEFPGHLPASDTATHFVGLRLPDVRRVVELLAERSIYASARGRHLRISPNVWNDASDVESLVTALRSLGVSPCR